MALLQTLFLDCGRQEPSRCHNCSSKKWLELILALHSQHLQRAWKVGVWLPRLHLPHRHSYPGDMRSQMHVNFTVRSPTCNHVA
eukprot:5946312-Amphidinium_carterae.1